MRKQRVGGREAASARVGRMPLSLFLQQPTNPGPAAHMNSLERSCRRQARRKLARKRRQYEAPNLRAARAAMRVEGRSSECTGPCPSGASRHRQAWQEHQPPPVGLAGVPDKTSWLPQHQAGRSPGGARQAHLLVVRAVEASLSPPTASAAGGAASIRRCGSLALLSQKALRMVWAVT